MMRDGWGHSEWPLGVLMMVVVWALVFWLVLSIVRRTSPDATNKIQQTATPQPRTALDVLDERLARGEIDTEDYESRRRALTHT